MLRKKHRPRLILTTVNKAANSNEQRESDLESYHILRVKCPVFSIKLQHIQRNRKVWLIQKKTGSKESVPAETVILHFQDKHFKTIFKRHSK